MWWGFPWVEEQKHRLRCRALKISKTKALEAHRLKILFFHRRFFRKFIRNIFMNWYSHCNLVTSPYFVTKKEKKIEITSIQTYKYHLAMISYLYHVKQVLNCVVLVPDLIWICRQTNWLILNSGKLMKSILSTIFTFWWAFYFKLP